MGYRLFLLVLLIITISNVYSSLTFTQLPLPSTSSFKGMFLRKVTESQIYIGNLYKEIHYDLISNTILKEYSNESLCADGTKCPLLMLDGTTPTHLISGKDGKVRIVDLYTRNIINKSYLNDLSSSVQ